MEGLWEVFREYEMAYNGISREQMIVSLCLGYAAALFVGTFLGMLSDLIGQKKVCLLFCSLHLFIAIWKRVTADPSVWLASICLSLASTIFFFNFETGMVVEHDKLGQRQDLMNDMFWLMAFAESSSFIGSQVLGNWLIGGNGKRSMLSPSGAVVLLAFIALIHVSRGWKEDPKSTSLKDYHTKFHTYILSGPFPIMYIYNNVGGVTNGGWIAVKVMDFFLLCSTVHAFHIELNGLTLPKDLSDISISIE
ncbi:PREDICTED: uncharacterized protein LOC109242814 [Nicotiana attenuata]|uniref:uncharacterized protein LOC109242814 n=1 Tax=Nicotiana attenuata TaxID=49451 RepID=UPI000904F58B|nr:PREDICTED: uncharacterized protein LOC109242814 [Nicotiana attenuata]